MKNKLLSICALATLGVFAAVGFSRQNDSRLSDVALANIEALAEEEEGTPVSICYSMGSGEKQDWFFECDSHTSPDMIYPCPGNRIYGSLGASSLCTK